MQGRSATDTRPESSAHWVIFPEMELGRLTKPMNTYGRTEAAHMRRRKLRPVQTLRRFLVGWGWVPQEGLPLPPGNSPSLLGSRTQTGGKVSFRWNVQGSGASARLLCCEGRGHSHI